MKDPIELQCLTEQMNSVILVTTDIVENNDDVNMNNDILLVIYRALHLTHWLKGVCFNINEINPTKDLVSEIITALQHVEGLINLCLWQKIEPLKKSIEVALAEAGKMASEAELEANRLYLDDSQLFSSATRSTQRN